HVGRFGRREEVARTGCTSRERDVRGGSPDRHGLGVPCSASLAPGTDQSWLDGDYGRDLRAGSLPEPVVRSEVPDRGGLAVRTERGGGPASRNQSWQVVGDCDYQHAG